MNYLGRLKVSPPKGNSTPKLVHITCRRSIRDMETVSPIAQKRSPAKKSNLNSSNENHQTSPKRERLLDEVDKANDDSEYDSSSISDTSSSDDEGPMGRSRSRDPARPRQPINVLESFFGYHLIFIIVFGGIIFTLSKAIEGFGEQQKNATCVKIDDLMQKFPSQTSEFWLSLDSAIGDVNRLNKPSTFLLFHDQNSRGTVEELLENVSKYTACRIKNVDVAPISVNGADWKAVEDYGVLLEKYVAPLSDNGVLVVKDIQRLSGNVAQVFHSICDEYNPLVKKAVIFLTVEINPWKNLPEEDNAGKYISDYLRPVWSSIDDEKFYPLFTRISNIVLQIFEEKPK